MSSWSLSVTRLFVTARHEELVPTLAKGEKVDSTAPIAGKLGGAPVSWSFSEPLLPAGCIAFTQKPDRGHVMGCVDENGS